MDKTSTLFLLITMYGLPICLAIVNKIRNNLKLKYKNDN